MVIHRVAHHDNIASIFYEFILVFITNGITASTCSNVAVNDMKSPISNAIAFLVDIAAQYSAIIAITQLSVCNEYLFKISNIDSMYDKHVS